ncbi:MAG: class I SAM-dependent methyltransferase, partial [Pseudomonadota bacterium]
MVARYKAKPAVDSLISFKNSQGLLSKGTLLSLNNNVIVFEVYNPYSIVQTSEVLTEFSIKKSNALIYKGKAIVVHLVNTGLMLIVSAKLEEDWLGQLEHLDLASGSVAQFLEAWEAHGKLLPNFRMAVEEMRSFLFEFGRWLSVSQLAGTAQSSTESLEHITEMLWPKWIALMQKFEREAAHIPENLTSIHRTFIQHNLHPLLLSAPIVHRTYTKPLGYAGDYEMINMILRNTFEGESDYAKIVHKLNVLPPTPLSVRYRNDIMLDYVLKGAQQAAERQQTFKMLSIACGPAVEIQRFIKQHATLNQALPITIELLDFSQHTLDETKKKISAVLEQTKAQNIQVHYICESVYTLLKNPQQIEQRLKQYDLVYSGGLFDYLSNQVCTRLLKLFYKWLKPGGKAFTTNMHLADPERFWMAYIFEWFLIYRNEADMLAWVKNLGRQRVFADETGINLFLEIE